MSINKEDIPKYQTSTPGREGQSDAPIVVKVADLIDMAMGPIEKNTVNFKMIQTILHILARNMRLLDQPVELRSSDATQPQYSKKEIPKLAYFGDMPSCTESENRAKTAATTAKGKEKTESHKPKDQEKIERERNEKEKEDTASSSSSSLLNMEHVNMDEIMAKYFNEKEKTDPEETKQAKLLLIRKIYLHEYNKKEREKPIKGRADRYKDKEDLSLSALYEKEKESSTTVDGTEGKTIQVKAKETREKEKAMYRKNESAYLASSSSVLSSSTMYDSSNEDENQKLSYEIERLKNSQMEPEEKLTKIAAIREMHFQEKEREKAKVALMNDEERNIYLKDKYEKKITKERERYEKGEAKLVKLEEKEKAKLDAEENNKERYKMRESLSDKEERKRVNLEQKEKYVENLANMNEIEREKYLKKKETEERDMLKNKERADSDIEKEIERKRYETEIPLLEMNDEENEKYSQNKVQRERAKLDAMDIDRIEEDKLYKRDLEKDLKQKEIEESKTTKLDVKNIEEKQKDKEIMGKKNEEEIAKLAKMNDDEKEKYLRVKEQREQTKHGALERERAEKEIEEKEKAKIALMNETEREQFLKQKVKLKLDAQGRERVGRDNEIESNVDQKEIEKLANMDDEQRENYFKDKEERKIADFDAQDREITGKEMDEKEKTKLALMNETEREKYLKQKQKEGIENSKLNALKERAEREREREIDEKEKTKIALMNETEREKYLKQKQKEGIEKSKLDALKERAEREKKQREQEMDEKEKTKLALMNETEREIYIKLKEKEEKEKSELDALDALKERAESEKKQENEREREKHKEKTKMALMNETERRKYLKKIENQEKTKSKLDALNKEQAEKNKNREQEREREQEKAKGSERNLKEKEWAKDTRTRVGSIEVVTRSEFELLEAKVNDLQEKTSPIPYPSMPDNQKLRTDLARGSASLTETMQAMQVSSRVQATEAAMARMADLLTQLAAAGALPEDVVQQVGEVTAGMGRPPPGEVAMEDLMSFAKAKASGSELFEFTYKMEIELNNLKDELHSLASAIGDPMAILLSRKISEGGSCGPCQAPARQNPTADCQSPLLPAAVRRPPPIPEEPCKLLVKQLRQLNEREHICKRWAGGSHTLVNKSVVHQDSGDIIRMNMPPTKKYTGIGIDGRLYQLEEALRPCGDCNKAAQEETKVQEEGAGEPGVKKLQLNFE